METRLGKEGLAGGQGGGQQNPKGALLRWGLGCPMIFALPFLPSVSNMEEPRRGELRCAGEVDGEKWNENFKGRRHTSRLCPSCPLLCPISHPLLSSQATEENVQERE